MPHTMKRHGQPPPVPVYNGPNSNQSQPSANHNKSVGESGTGNDHGNGQLDQSMVIGDSFEGGEEVDGDQGHEGGGGGEPGTEEHRLLVANLQSQFAANPNLAGHFLQILMSNIMSNNQGGNTSSGGSSIPSESASPTESANNPLPPSYQQHMNSNAEHQQRATSPPTSSLPYSVRFSTTIT